MDKKDRRLLEQRWRREAIEKKAVRDLRIKAFKAIRANLKLDKEFMRVVSGF